MTNQPLLRPAAATKRRPRPGDAKNDATRLFRTWRDVTRRVIYAEAHGRDEEAASLRRTQFALEEAIEQRHPQLAVSLLQDYILIESRLAHEGEPTNCLTCRKVWHDLPLDEPLPVQGGWR